MTTTDETTTTDPGPFGIDTPDFSDRDREMFVLGVEYARATLAIQSGRAAGAPLLIHAANMARIRKAANDEGRSCWFAPTEDEDWLLFGVGGR